MLRPSKLFVSFHQLRHYFQTKISELAHPVNNQQIINYKHSITQQPNIQQFFANIFHRSTSCSNAIPNKQYVHQQVKLLKVLQHHFPVVKVFSTTPAYHATYRRPVLGIWSANQQQFRTMMSGTSGPANGLAWGFPRTTTVGRGPGFARQFSTTKSPCVTIFQNTNQPSNMAHVSRIFSPAGTKINNTPSSSDEVKPTTVKSSSFNQPKEEDESEPNYHRMFSPKNGGMRELVSLENDTNQHYVYHLDAKRHHHSESDETVTKKDNDVQKKLKCIVQHDELSSLRHHVTSPSVEGEESVRKRSNPVRKKPDKRARRLLQSDSDLMSTLNKNTNDSSIHLRITLDMLQFFDCPSGVIDTSFIHSFEFLHHAYQIHMHYVLNLLQRLDKTFKVVIEQGELFIYFPSPAPKSKRDAVRLLETMGIFPEEDYLIQQNKVDCAVGPNYFKDIQLFIDHIDTLIDSGPAFSRKKFINR
ncbi:hypothetical protein G6F46_005149 [Rhizopus delemar]|uniref:Uncharacterized protein n=1 Tax=Rhizopus delemar (strain RA 99-880 / ATCC MYA-4621 / FGSC 9543 / NRRL 43880) TaxID=246409 RepID=I1BJ60_RHIO9|nr:hypothetical protein RO3G_00944 [Rhizopus delemar RA 99-880]KAG1493246.1 hypothetical protein G6F54_008715 [Rhizopus delemar]KAG1514478.1 hypothetical protein G6F53_003645 [Rhizopus delemar]KAG1586478.1 hypothetical protein G6F48_006576 [Rhizopus delemar]KAG1604057.1 hypothetical protein G6F47_001277 [Rhizopus delemar]|eukprot:EIE76240.1 hypothetical protein RO3G_00944 [Rhizopus delemar RA 99-880]